MGSKSALTPGPCRLGLSPPQQPLGLVPSAVTVSASSTAGERAGAAPLHLMQENKDLRDLY